MGREPRIDFPGAFFQVIVRRNHRATIFHAAADYTAYPNRLATVGVKLCYLDYLG